MAPPSASGSHSKVAFAAVAPPPDPNDASAIDQQLAAADQSEQDVTAQDKAGQTRSRRERNFLEHVSIAEP